MLINVQRTDPTKAQQRLASHARLTAAALPPYTGFGTAQDQRTIRSCRHAYPYDAELWALCIFTRDEGMHACGWWKNPDYERCEHLSVSFGRGAPDGAYVPAPQDHARAKVWCKAFFGDRCRLLWIEPPFSAQGQARDVYHYRLFMAPDWRLPVLPRGEVYTLEFTAKGWRSWSDQHPPEDFPGDTPP